MLQFVRALVHHPEKASIQKAQFLAEEVICGGPGSRSPRTIKRHWSEFRTVSHLHAAFLMATTRLADQADRAATPAFWDSVLGGAHHLLQTALERDPAKLLNRNGWWIAAHCKCSDGFGIDPFGEEQLQRLSRYRAPTRDK
jgi:hypothetical protein